MVPVARKYRSWSVAIVPFPLKKTGDKPSPNLSTNICFYASPACAPSATPASAACARSRHLPPCCCSARTVVTAVSIPTPTKIDPQPHRLPATAVKNNNRVGVQKFRKIPNRHPHPALNARRRAQFRYGGEPLSDCRPRLRIAWPPIAPGRAACAGTNCNPNFSTYHFPPHARPPPALQATLFAYSSPMQSSLQPRPRGTGSVGPAR